MTNLESPRHSSFTGLIDALQRPRSDAAPLSDLTVVAGGDGSFSSCTSSQGRAVGPQCTDDIEVRVRKLVAAWLGMEECDIRPDSDLRNDFGAESLKVVKLVMALEVESGVETTDDDVERIEIVRQAVDYLEKAVPT